jgi:tRNA-splicing ligase RtcB
MSNYTEITTSNIPIKIWGEVPNLDEATLNETIRVAELPYAESHVALMADGHATGGYMPVGGVLATKDVVVPDAVSNDIGCGIIFKQTNIDSSVLEEKEDGITLAQKLVNNILRAVPTGREHWGVNSENNDNIKLCELNIDLRDRFSTSTINTGKVMRNHTLNKLIEQSYEIVGTLGGGNHFIEIQKNQDNKIAIMIHTGSRSVGSIVNTYFHNLAEKKNEEWYIDVIADDIIPFLLLRSKEGEAYLDAMQYALDVAKLNREVLMKKAETALKDVLSYVDYEITREVNAHHNYASYENVNGVNYMVHRKGAIRARESDIIPIAGAMGANSYICKGKSNPDSFKSCSHGAGRVHSRTSARNEFSIEEVKKDLKEKNIAIAVDVLDGVVEEYRLAYKNIDNVIKEQEDLIDVVDVLSTVAVVKG